MSPRFTRSAAPVLILSAALSAAALSGCGGTTPAQEAIHDASAMLHGLGVSGSEPLPSVSDRKQRYQSVVKAIKPIADADDGADAAAARVLLAKAQGGLGDISASDAADVERAALDQIRGIRAALEQWLSQRSIAQALQAYDPTQELAKLDDEIRQREAEAGRAEEAKQKQVALVEQTRAKAAQARAQAEQFRTQEASIRAGVASASQTQRAAAFEQAMTVRRQGDEYEKQAADADAIAASQEPVVGTLQNAIEKLNRQVQLLRDAKQALVARADANRAQAADAAKEADAASARVTDLLKELDATRSGIGAPTDEAARLYGSAVGAARKASLAGAGANGRGVGPMMAGNLQQSLGDLLAGKARSLGAYAALLRSLQTSGHPAASAEAVKAAEQAHTEALTAAEDAYKSAISIFESAGGNAEAKEKIDRLTKQIQSLVSEEAAPAGGQPVEKPAESSTGAPSDKPAEAAADFDKAAVEAEIRQFVQEVHGAMQANQFEVIAERTRFDNEDQKKAVEAMAHGFGAIVKLDDAAKAKFGKGLADLAAESKSAQALGPAVQMFAGKESIERIRQSKLDPSTVRIDVKSATEGAVYNDPDHPDKPQTVRKSDGRWWMVAEQSDLMGAAMLAPTLSKLGTLCDDLRGRVESGALATADDLLAAFAEGMKSMVPGGLGGAPGPGGG